MRLLADENFPRATVTALRQQGHDVVWIHTDALSSSDGEILARAQAEERIILTFDKDFGELAFRLGLPAKSGIILFRIPLSSPDSVTSIVTTAIATRSSWGGLFTVVESDRVRIRPLPGSVFTEQESDFTRNFLENL